MGRPRELSDEEKKDLEAAGYRAVEVLMPDIWSERFWSQVYKDCELIRASDRRTGMDKTLDAFARDLWDDIDR